MELKSHEFKPVVLEKLSTRQKIIQVTIRMISREGIHNLTTRSIAAEAEVNIAAVNYYFGSKEKLIEESLDSAIKHMFADTSEFFRNLDAKAAFKNIMLYFFEGSVQHPGIIKAILHDPINNNLYESPVMQQITHFIHEIISKIDQTSDSQTDSTKIKVLQMISATLLPALLPDLFRNILGDGFQNDPDLRQKYIDQFFTQP
jgi:AcrR family transcriptional regulator